MGFEVFEKFIWAAHIWIQILTHVSGDYSAETMCNLEIRHVVGTTSIISCPLNEMEDVHQQPKRKVPLDIGHQCAPSVKNIFLNFIHLSKNH